MLRSLARFARSLRRAEGGAAAVELAFALPVMLILVIGIAEIGRALWYHQTVSKSVRDAVRYLTRVPVDNAAACTFDGTFEARARNLALYGNLDGSGSPLISYWSNPNTVGITGTPVNNDPPALRGPATICRVSVTAQVPFTFPLLGFMGIPTTITMTVADQQRHIGE